jgi:sulfonate transport system ATP-binding protein
MGALTQPARGARIALEGLRKSFDRPVLHELDLQVAPGEFIAIVGRSGSGKTTLLKILCGLEPPSAGCVRIEQENGAEASAEVCVVFQEPRLLPWRNVLDNVCIGLGGADRSLAREVLARVGLGDRLAEYPAVLSGGQKQRVALARALVRNPKVMLLDEPFGALDALTRLGAQKLVETLWQQRGFTAVLVTHDVEEAVSLADRVLVFEEGRIVASETIDWPRPRARELPEFGRRVGRLLAAILGDGRRPALESAEACNGSLATPEPAAGARLQVVDRAAVRARIE